MQIIGSVANITIADCKTSGVDCVAIPSESVTASDADERTMFLRRYWIGCSDFVVM